MRFTRTVATYVLLAWAGSLSAMPITNYVSVGGQQWAQPNDFTSLQWGEIDAVCPGGVCNGSLTSDSGTYTMDGWTFADVDAINDLFNTYIAAAGGTAAGYPLSGPSEADELDSTWAPAFLADFSPVDSSTIAEWVEGFSSTVSLIEPQIVYSPAVFDFTRSGVPDRVQTRRGAFIDDPAFPGLGAWFVRDAPAAVPAPATLLLLGLGLLGLQISRLRDV